MYVFRNIYIHTCVCVYILKYNLLSLYNVTCVHVFRADHLVLVNQLVCSPLEKTVLLLLFLNCL